MDKTAAAAVLAGFDPSRYYRYADIDRFTAAWAAAYPDLCRRQVIGHTPEGRDIFCLTLTNFATGADAEKPAYFVDANVHAGEVTGSAAALYTIDQLLKTYGTDPEVATLLDTRAVYIIPRISMDGAEFYLTTPYRLRSAPRLYPHAEVRPGLQPEDIDGDGKILVMRIQDPNGTWKQADEDPRLLVKRRPDDREGPFFQVYQEGLLQEWDGHAVRHAPARWGLDLNRNYPAFWNPEGRQPGASRYPLSEPETRAVATWLSTHPNIGCYLSYHTTGGVLLRPPAMGADDKIPAADAARFKAVGEVCTRIMGYPCKSTYDAFTYDPDQALVKGADDWAYEHLGVLAYTMELWDLEGRAGARGYAQIGVKGALALSDDELAVDELKRLQWNDRELGGTGFTPWRRFDHPQLGEVEIGGWDPKFCDQNPPEGALLLDEVTRAYKFSIQHGLATPRVTFGRVDVQPLAPGVYKLAAEVVNEGFLGTQITDAGVQMKQSRPVEATIDLPDGARIVSARGEGRESGRVLVLGHLQGRVDAAPSAWGFGAPPANDAWAEWVIAAPAGAEVTLTAGCPRAGTVRKRIVL